MTQAFRVWISDTWNSELTEIVHCNVINFRKEYLSLGAAEIKLDIQEADLNSYCQKWIWIQNTSISNATPDQTSSSIQWWGYVDSTQIETGLTNTVDLFDEATGLEPKRGYLSCLEFGHFIQKQSI